MPTNSIDFQHEAEKLLNRLDGSSPPLEILEQLHRYGVWVRGSIRPRGSFAASAASPFSHLMPRVLFLIGSGVEKEICRKALLVIGQWGGAECLADVIQLLWSPDTDSDTRLYCLSAIRNIGGPRAVMTIARVLGSGEPDLQESAISAILDLATGGSASDIDSATNSVPASIPAQTLAPEVAIELMRALTDLSENLSAPFKLRFRVTDTLMYLQTSGLLKPVTSQRAVATDKASSSALALHTSTGYSETDPLRHGLQHHHPWLDAVALPAVSGGGRPRRDDDSVTVEVPLIRADGHEENVVVKVLPITDFSKRGLEQVGPRIYLSQDKTVVILMQIPEKIFPDYVAAIRVSAIVDETEARADMTLTPGAPTAVLEFEIPEAFRSDWCENPQLRLREA